jgi:hypothetical protein
MQGSVRFACSHTGTWMAPWMWPLMDTRFPSTRARPALRAAPRHWAWKGRSAWSSSATTTAATPWALMGFAARSRRSCMRCCNRRASQVHVGVCGHGRPRQPVPPRPGSLPCGLGVLRGAGGDRAHRPRGKHGQSRRRAWQGRRAGLDPVFPGCRKARRPRGAGIGWRGGTFLTAWPALTRSSRMWKWDRGPGATDGAGPVGTPSPGTPGTNAGAPGIAGSDASDEVCIAALVIGDEFVGQGHCMVAAGSTGSGATVASGRVLRAPSVKATPLDMRIDWGHRNLFQSGAHRPRPTAWPRGGNPHGKDSLRPL